MPKSSTYQRQPRSASGASARTTSSLSDEQHRLGHLDVQAVTASTPWRPRRADDEVGVVGAGEGLARHVDRDERRRRAGRPGPSTTGSIMARSISVSRPRAGRDRDEAVRLGGRRRRAPSGRAPRSRPTAPCGERDDRLEPRARTHRAASAVADRRLERRGGARPRSPMRRVDEDRSGRGRLPWPAAGQGLASRSRCSASRPASADRDADARRWGIIDWPATSMPARAWPRGSARRGRRRRRRCDEVGAGRRGTRRPRRGRPAPGLGLASATCAPPRWCRTMSPAAWPRASLTSPSASIADAQDGDDAPSRTELGLRRYVDAVEHALAAGQPGELIVAEGELQLRAGTRPRPGCRAARRIARRSPSGVATGWTVSAIHRVVPSRAQHAELALARLAQRGPRSALRHRLLAVVGVHEVHGDGADAGPRAPSRERA